MEESAGTLLGGRLRYAQPVAGYRTGIEPVLLAAAVPAQAGERVLEAGTGAGAALMCLAARVAGVSGLGVEIDPGMAALARRNVAANGFEGLVIRTGDLLGVEVVGFHHAMANPPWHGRGSTPSPVAGRRLAKQEGDGGLEGWIGALRRAVLPGGTVTVIVPAAQAGRAGVAMRGCGLGGIVETPLLPKVGRAAKLALVAGRLGGGEDRVAAGVVLHEADGGFTAGVEAVLREGVGLGVDGPPARTMTG